MGVPLKPPLVLMLGGTSLTSGYLATPPLPWTYYLQLDMQAHPSCKGEVIILNTGKGSQTSNYGAAEAILMAPLRPTHVLMEDFGINDCAIGPLTLQQATDNFYSMVNSYRAANPDVIICHQTMSPASAGDIFRTNLADYYNNGTANATALGLETLGNYNGTALVPGGWVKPLPLNLTVGYSPLGNAPAGFGLFTAGTTWDALFNTSGRLLTSVDGLTITRLSASSGSISSMRATNTMAAGKFYIEQTAQYTGGTDASIMGIATAGMTIGDYPGSVANSYGIYVETGNILANNGSVVGSLGVVASGTVIGIAVDLVNNKIWFRAGSGNWNGTPGADPATNVGGITITANAYYPAAALSATGDTVTINFGSGGDGLHPVWPNAFHTYSYPNILAWAIRMMQAYWPN